MKQVLLALCVLSAFACGAGLTASQLWDYNEQQEECVSTSSTKAAADACRAASRAAFCAAHPGLDSRCDAGFEGGDQ